MKKKFLLFLLALFVLPLSLILVGCGDNKEATILGFKFKYNDVEETTLNFEYDYGTHVQMPDYSVVVNYSDGTTSEVTEDIASQFEAKYYKNGIEFPENQSGIFYSKLANGTLDAGDYTLQATHIPTNTICYIFIRIVPVEASMTAFTISVKNASNNSIISTVDYDTASIDDNNLTSQYVVCVSNGGNLLDKNEVNGIYALDATDYATYSALTTRNAKQAFLESHTTNSINYNWDGPSTNERYFYVNTSRDNLLPGSYHLFADINTNNYEKLYCEPSTELIVNKRSVNFITSMVDGNKNEQGGPDKNQEDLWTYLNLKASFDYGSSVWDADLGYSVYQIGNITLGELNEKDSTFYKVGDLDEDLGIPDGLNPGDPGYDDYVNATRQAIKERFKINIGYGEENLFDYGTFKFKNVDTPVNSGTGTNGESSQVVEFVLNDYYAARYVSTGDKNIKLTITKGIVAAPYTANTEYDELQGKSVPADNWTGEYSYGEDVSLPLLGIGEWNQDLYQYGSNSTFTAQNVGNYFVIVMLRDSNNYVFQSEGLDTEKYFYGDSNRRFSWSIEKRTVDAAPIKTITYNNVEYGSNCEITYVSGQTSIGVAFTCNPEWFDKPYFDDREFNWSISCSPALDPEVVASLANATGGLSNTINFTSVKKGTENVNIIVTISCAAEASFNAFEYSVCIKLLPAELTDAQKETLYSGETPELDAELYNNELYIVGDLQITKITQNEEIDETLHTMADVTRYYIENTQIPATALTSVGSWKLYYTYEGETKEVTFDVGNPQWYEIILTGVNDENPILDADIDDMEYELNHRTSFFFVFDVTDPCVADIKIQVGSNKTIAAAI